MIKLIKSTDGYEIKPLDWCHLESGQQAILYDAVRDGEESSSYLVAPYYEGEAMGCDCAGGEHSEYNVPFEQEGETTIVSAVYKHPPTEKISGEIKMLLDELATCSSALALTKVDQNKADKELKAKTREISEADKTRDALKADFDAAKSLVACEMEKVSAARQVLSDTQDAMPKTINGDSVQVGKEELAKLRKTAFMMECMDAGGVDNWEWIGESLKPYYERYPQD